MLLRRECSDCATYEKLEADHGGYWAHLVVAAAATLHLQMTFAETEELRLWLRTQGWPTEASPVVQMLLPAVITTIWKKAAKKTEKGAGKWLYGQLRRARAKYVEGNSYEAANGGAISGCSVTNTGDGGGAEGGAVYSYSLSDAYSSKWFRFE